MPFRNQIISKGMIIFNDAVVNNNKFTCTITVGVCIFCRWSTMGCPSRMTQTYVGRSYYCFIYYGFKLCQLTFRTMFNKFSVFKIYNPCGVIASIFKTPETFKYYWNNTLWTTIANNTTHILSSLI